MRDNYDPTTQMKYEGYLETTKAVVVKTNSDNPQMSIYDPTLLYDATTTTVAEEALKINTEAIPYFESDELQIKGRKTLAQLFMYLSLAYLETVKLPISLKETTI